MASEFPDGGISLKQANQMPLTQAEVEDMVRQMMEADADTVWDLLTAHLKIGKSIRSLGDTIQIGAAELILRTTVPRQFTNGQHPFDYCNVANNWFRTNDNPYQPRVLYLMAHFINDVAHENKLQNSVIEQEAAGIDSSGLSPEVLLRDLDEAIMALDFPRATAFANAYLQSGADCEAYQSTVALAACRFQDDPHNQKITISTFEEYAHNSTHLRDRLLLATARLLAGWVKMPGERDCYARFEKDWKYN
jgi:DNA polymerase III gamma/tau subunit